MPKLGLPLGLPSRARTVGVDLGVRRVDDEDSREAIEHDALIAGEARSGVPEAQHGWQTERTRENRDVRGTGAAIGRDADDRFAIQLDREARGEIVG